MYMRKPKRALTGLALILSMVLSPLGAQEVTLKSLDGTVSMSGELLEYDGLTYRISMLIGEISIDAAQVVCEGEGCPNLMADITEFSISGSNAISSNLLPTLIEVFALDRGGDLDVSVGADGLATYTVLEADGSVYATISVQASDSADGLASLLEGTASIGMTSRRVSVDEAAAFELAGGGDLRSPEQERIIAMDGVIVAVNRDNPVSILSLEQIAGIFGRNITNWNQVGGPDAPINLYRRDVASGTVSVFSDVVLDGGQLALSNVATVLATDAEVADAVAADQNGIGVTSYAQERSARALALRAICGQLFEPSEFTIKSEEYPLTRRMYLYTKSEALPDVANAFLEFVTSPAAQSVISNSGFIGQNPSRATLDEQGRRMAQAIVSSSGRTELLQLQDLTASVLDAERLSFTLRLNADGTLDSRALADVERMSAQIRDGAFSSRQILVLGFSDNTGAVNAQLNTTQFLAEDVRDAIVEATGRANMGNVRISPIGYGRLLPLACNESSFGKASNNRVEIWVK